MALTTYSSIIIIPLHLLFHLCMLLFECLLFCLPSVIDCPSTSSNPSLYVVRLSLFLFVFFFKVFSACLGLGCNVWFFLLLHLQFICRASCRAAAFSPAVGMTKGPRWPACAPSVGSTLPRQPRPACLVLRSCWTRTGQDRSPPRRFRNTSVATAWP